MSRQGLHQWIVRRGNEAELDYVVYSIDGRTTTLAENYVGLPFEG